jgi:hypothetical protein
MSCCAVLCPAQAVNDLKAAGKSEKEINAFSTLFKEVQQQIDSKQLRPFIRTQYMRTAFQVGTPEGLLLAKSPAQCTLLCGPILEELGKAHGGSSSKHLHGSTGMFQCVG